MEEKLKEIMAEEFGIEPSEIQEDSKLIDDLGGDSLTIIALVADIEDAFDIKVDYSTFEKVVTYADMVKLLQEKLNEK